MPFAIDRIDHVVLNCRDLETTASWYQRVLGMQREEFGPDRRIALKFGSQKINLRLTGASNWPTGAIDAPGSLDLCFITTSAPKDVLERGARDRTAGPCRSRIRCGDHRLLARRG